MWRASSIERRTFSLAEADGVGAETVGEVAYLPAQQPGQVDHPWPGGIGLDDQGIAAALRSGKIYQRLATRGIKDVVVAGFVEQRPELWPLREPAGDRRHSSRTARAPRQDRCIASREAGPLSGAPAGVDPS